MTVVPVTVTVADERRWENHCNWSKRNTTLAVDHISSTRSLNRNGKGAVLAGFPKEAKGASDMEYNLYNYTAI